MSQRTIRRSTTTRAIVTGGAGFVGSHLVDRLLAEGVDVLVVDDLSSGGHENVAPAARLEQLDIATADLDRVFTAWRPGVVFHLAAQASVVHSQRDPMRDLAVNVIGTHRVASAARDAGAHRLVFVSSGGAVYGETHRPATERTIPAPSSYYGVHKLAAEGHVRLSGLPAAIARPSNIYGPRQSAGLEGAVVAAFIKQAGEGRLMIHGDGSQTRDFVHVRDVTDALWRLGIESAPTGTWNVATGTAHDDHGARGRRRARLRDGACTGCSGPDAQATSPAPCVSAGRLKALGWRPEVRLSAGIAELVREASPTGDRRP